MKIVHIIDADKAQLLKNMGYQCQEKYIGDKKVYEFFGTDDLLKELSSKFEQGSFLLQKNMCF